MRSLVANIEGEAATDFTSEPCERRRHLTSIYASLVPLRNALRGESRVSDETVVASTEKELVIKYLQFFLKNFLQYLQIDDILVLAVA